MPIKRLLPKKLDLYLLVEVISPFIGGVIFFLFIFLMSRILVLADFFILHGTPAWLLGKMVSLMVLSFLPTAITIAFLIAVLMAFGRLSADSELVAMKACGVSLWRMAAPVAFLATVVVGLSLFLNFEWVPWSERTFKTTLIKVGNTKVVSSIKEGTFTSGFFDLLIFADKVDTKTSRLKRVFIFDEREPKNPLTVVAQSGEIVQVKTGQDLGTAAVLKLFNGSIHRNDSAEGSYQKIEYGEYKLFLKVDEGTHEDINKPQMIPYRDLMNKIANTTTDSYEGREWRGEFWRRYSVAIAPFIFVFLGIGFGTVRTRAVRAGAALVALVTLFCYWALQTAGTIAVQRGYLPPFVAMQVPNFIVLVAAVISFRRAMW